MSFQSVHGLSSEMRRPLALLPFWHRPLIVLFHDFYQLGWLLKATAVIFFCPALKDLVNWQRVEKVQFLPSAPTDKNKLCRLKQRDVLGHCLTRHMEGFTQFVYSLAVVLLKPIRPSFTLNSHKS